MKRQLFKLLGKRYSWLAIRYRNAQTYCYSVLHPYHYDAERYAGSFLDNTCEFKYSNQLVRHIDRVIYIFWTGDNVITSNRLEAIRSLEKVSGVEVKLITSNNLFQYIKEDDPLPEVYQYLSYVHRADYLRTYFMHHYGGGYADIKPATDSWINAFKALENSEAYIIGYPEVGLGGVANNDIENAHLKQDLHNHWRYLIGNCAYICRPYTPFSTEWYAETKRRVLEYSKDLIDHPASNPFGTNSDYPIHWNYILGQVFHPLCLKYHDRLLKDNALIPSFENYR